MFSTFDLCFLLYMIRLAGWLKHCYLSLSLSVLLPVLCYLHGGYVLLLCYHSVTPCVPELLWANSHESSQSVKSHTHV